MAVKFITNPDNSGWLLVRIGDLRVSLPRYLKVDHHATRNGRDYFRILEGAYQNQQASVAHKPDGGSYLGRGRHLNAGQIKFNRSTNQLWYGNTGTVHTITDSGNPIPLGTHNLGIPDSPHAGGISYASRSSFTTVWFPIRKSRVNTSLDRYLHPGNLSAGCVTVKDVETWSAIYGYLVDRRKDSKDVGTLIVVE